MSFIHGCMLILRLHDDFNSPRMEKIKPETRLSLLSPQSSSITSHAPSGLKKMYPMNDHTSISASHVPVSKSAGMAVPSSSIIERSIVATSPGVALAVLSLVAREKERGVDGTKGPFRKKAKP